MNLTNTVKRSLTLPELALFQLVNAKINNPMKKVKAESNLRIRRETLEKYEN